MWLLVTVVPQEEISQAGREDNFYMEKTVELSWQAELVCSLVVWPLPSHRPRRGEKQIPSLLSGMEMPDKQRLGKPNDEINEDRIWKGSSFS